MKRERRNEKGGKREKEGRKNRRYRGEKVTRLIASAEHDQPPPPRVLVLFIPVIAPSSERASVALLSRAGARKPEIYARNYKLFLAGRDFELNANQDYREA